jgi:hypothetical protein
MTAVFLARLTYTTRWCVALVCQNGQGLDVFQ